MGTRSRSGMRASSSGLADAPARVTYAVAAATTIGLEPTRTTNQDAYGTLFGEALCGRATEAWGVLCLADGMGGMAAGEVASEVAVRAVLAEAAGLAGRGWVRAAEQVPLV